jgi:hypothetical protein
MAIERGRCARMRRDFSLRYGRAKKQLKSYIHEIEVERDIPYLIRASLSKKENRSLGYSYRGGEGCINPSKTSGLDTKECKLHSFQYNSIHEKALKRHLYKLDGRVGYHWNDPGKGHSRKAHHCGDCYPVDVKSKGCDWYYHRFYIKDKILYKEARQELKELGYEGTLRSSKVPKVIIY